MRRCVAILRPEIIWPGRQHLYSSKNTLISLLCLNRAAAQSSTSFVCHIAAMDACLAGQVVDMMQQKQERAVMQSALRFASFCVYMTGAKVQYIYHLGLLKKWAISR